MGRYTRMQEPEDMGGAKVNIPHEAVPFWERRGYVVVEAHYPVALYDHDGNRLPEGSTPDDVPPLATEPVAEPEEPEAPEQPEAAVIVADELPEPAKPRKPRQR